MLSHILVLPFWYQLTQVVSGKGSLNGCVCVTACVLKGTILITYITTTTTTTNNNNNDYMPTESTTRSQNRWLITAALLGSDMSDGLMINQQVSDWTSELPELVTVNEQEIKWANDWMGYLMNSKWVLLRVSRFHDGSSEASTQCHFTFHRNVTQKTASINVINCMTINQVHKLPSVLWRYWLGGRKGIRPVKNWAVGCWCGCLSGVRCWVAYVPADATATHCLLLQ